MALDSPQCLRSTTAGELSPPFWSIPWHQDWEKHAGHWSWMTNMTHIHCSPSLLCPEGPWLVVHCREMTALNWRSCDHIGQWGSCGLWLLAAYVLTLVESKYTRPKELRSWALHVWVDRSGRCVALEKPSGSSSSFWSASGGKWQTYCSLPLLLPPEIKRKKKQLSP